MSATIVNGRTVTPARRRAVLAGGMLVLGLGALDSNVVNTALPRIVGDLGGLAHLSWVVTGFMLSSTITTPIYGKLSDTFGRRPMFMVAILVFMAGSLLCGAAASMGQLIAYRTVQGLGAGGLIVLAQASIGDVVAAADRPRYQALLTGTFAFASVAGPVIGGLITQALSWRWVFYVNLPIAPLALISLWIGLRPGGSGRTGALDLPGAGLLAAMTTLLLLWLAWGGNTFPWLSPRSAGFLAVVAALFGTFLWREHVASDPLIRLKLFTNRVYARAVTMGGMMSFAMLGSTVFLPLYFQLVLGMQPASAGAMMVPQMVGMLLSSIVNGRFVVRMGRSRPFMIVGIGLEAGALGGLALLSILGAPSWMFVAILAVLGVGMGMGMPNVTTMVQNSVAYGEIGAATGTMTFVRSLGGAVGVAASGSIMSARLAAGLRHLGGQVDLGALTEHGVHALLGLTQAQHAAVIGAYRSALTGCFALSFVVMTAAFLVVRGMPDVRLRVEKERPGALAPRLTSS